MEYYRNYSTQNPANQVIEVIMTYCYSFMIEISRRKSFYN